MKMPRLSSRGTMGAASASVLAALLFAFSGAAVAGIADTKHNLGSGNTRTGENRVTGTTTATGTAEICVFCHTPHAADTAAPAPLWNKRLGANGVPTSGTGTYTTYASLGTPSLDGATAPVGSISAACLSCHDGTQAMDNIINAPGSGGLTADGGNTAGLGYTWATGLRVDADGKLNSGVAALGTDLSNDHPIGIEYCGGVTTGDPTTRANCKDSDFFAASKATINGKEVFWIDTGASGTRQRTDLPLYTRDSNLGSAAGPLVECATCHDPHVSEGQAGPTGTGRSAGATFLRISNASSALCLTCHDK